MACKRPAVHLPLLETQENIPPPPAPRHARDTSGARRAGPRRLRQTPVASGEPTLPVPTAAAGSRCDPAEPGWALGSASPVPARLSSPRPAPGRPTHPVPRAGPHRPRAPRPRRRAPPPRLLPIGPRPPPAPWLTGAAANRKS